MAKLVHLSSGTEHHLAARHLVGRSRSCHLHIDQASVSGVHSEIVWDGSCWQIQDLGSRNGTFVSGRKLASGEQSVIELGTQLAFGRTDNRYDLVDDTPPQLMAIAGSGEVSLAERDLLCLPSVDACEVMVFCDAEGRWQTESPDGVHAVDDQERLVAGRKSWMICLPARKPPTQDTQANPEPAVDDAQLQFFVSRDNEHVSMTVCCHGREDMVDSRAHVFLLMTLARARLGDAGAPAPLPASEHGWVHREDLMRMLKIDGQLLNLWVYRARQQFATLDFRGAASIIERRPGSHQLRIGSCRIRVDEA